MIEYRTNYIVYVDTCVNKLEDVKKEFADFFPTTSKVVYLKRNNNGRGTVIEPVSVEI